VSKVKETACGDLNCSKINAGIDKCIKPLINALNSIGVETVASCCGHGFRPTSIALKDGRELIIFPDSETARKTDHLFKDIHGESNNYLDELSRTKAELEEAKRLLNDLAIGVHMGKVQNNFNYVPNPDEAIDFLSNQQSEE